MDNNLDICVLKKTDGGIRLVFRKRNAIYRVQTIKSEDNLISELKEYKRNLDRNKINSQFLLVISGPRRKNRILEIGIARNKAELSVFEIAGKLLDLKFKWQGNKQELRSAFGNIVFSYY